MDLCAPDAKDADRDLVNEANADRWNQIGTIILLLGADPPKLDMCPWQRMQQIVDSVPLRLHSRLVLHGFVIRHRTPCMVCTAMLEAQLQLVAEKLPVVGGA
jgi:hypothetical protein